MNRISWISVRGGIKNRSKGFLLGAGWMAAAALSAMLAPECDAGAAQPAVLITTDVNHSAGTTKLDLGVTLNHKSFRIGSNAESVARAMELLKASGHYVNIFIMGLGSSIPEPMPGQFDWHTLDARVALARRTGAIPVMTLCCGALGWMRGDPPGGPENWTTVFNSAPDPEHYDDYADLVRHAALRYPDIKYFQVWGEFKGFRQTEPWQAEAFTKFYNKLYDTLKSVSSDIKVGGPYAPMVHWIGPRDKLSAVTGPYGTLDSMPLDAFDYWLAHKHGADFVNIDGSITAFVQTDGRTRFREAFGPDLFADTQIFADASKWVLSRTSLPLWWSEWTASPHNFGDDEQAALRATALIRFAPLVSVALNWSAEGDAQQDQGDQESLWSDARNEGGGKPFPFFAVVQGFRRCFPPGTALVDVHVSAPSIAALSSRTCTMLVNQSEEAVSVSLNGTPIGLGRFETRFVEGH